MLEIDHFVHLIICRLSEQKIKKEKKQKKLINDNFRPTW